MIYYFHMEKKPITESKTVQNSTATGSIPAIALAIVVVAKWLKIEVPFEEVMIVMTAVAVVGVAAWQIIERWRVGDLYLFNKPE